MRDPADHLPVKPVHLLILTLLSAGDRHGYGLRQDILRQTDGGIALEAGSLYRAIRVLEREGLVEEAGVRIRSGDDERRIYYRLLPFGRRVLAAELLRLRALIQVGVENGVIAPGRA